MERGDGPRQAPPEAVDVVSRNLRVRVDEIAGLDGADLGGGSVGGSFAAEMAAIFPAHVRKLCLIAPFGLFEITKVGLPVALAVSAVVPPGKTGRVVREAAEPFVSKLFPRGKRFLRTEPLKAMVIGAFVRGLSMRDVESLCEEAGLGQVS